MNSIKTFFLTIFAFVLTHMYYPLAYTVVCEFDSVDGSTQRYRLAVKSRFQLVKEFLDTQLDKVVALFEKLVVVIANNKKKTVALLAVASVIAYYSGLRFWSVWGWVLLWQNYAFTEVSRSRNSGSLRRHIRACFQSNGVYFAQMIFATNIFIAIIAGKFGVAAAIGALLYYNLFTMSGSVLAHHSALTNETGLNAVGASKKLAQITVAEYETLKSDLARALSNIESYTVNVKPLPIFVPPYTTGVIQANPNTATFPVGSGIAAGTATK